MVQEEITLEALEAQPKDTYLLVDISGRSSVSVWTYGRSGSHSGK